MTTNESTTADRAIRLRRIVADRLKRMSVQQRDRLMQTYIAQARGPVGNAEALRRMATTIIRARDVVRPRVDKSTGDAD